MNPIAVLRRYFANIEKSRQTQEEIREGVANLTDVTNRHLMKLAAIIESAVEQQRHADDRHFATLDKSRQTLGEIRHRVANLTDVTTNLTDVTNRHMMKLATIMQSAIKEARRSAAQNTAIQTPHVPNESSRTTAPSALQGPSVSTDRSPSPQQNDLASRAHIFDDIVPYSGTPRSGFYADWLGVIHDGAFCAYLGGDREAFGGVPVQTRRPILADGEAWFEAVNQVEAARDARGSYVMVTLGACYGAQAVGSAVALRTLNPMPFKLVAVEPEPVNYEWTAQHLCDNDINPDDHWLIQAAISDTNSPVFFPVGAPGSGTQNSFATNEAAARENYVRALIDSGRQDEALRNLLLRNTTGLKKNLLPGEGFDAEITLLSAVTLADVLAPLPHVDYLEADIQQSEILVFPPFMDLLKRKVRRVHIGTHGKDVHAALADMFRRDGWHIVFDYEPNSSHTHPMGSFELNDGVLTMLNPAFP